MTKFLLAAHVVAAIVAVGPVTVAASMFPRAVRRAWAESDRRQGIAVLHALHRVCRVYAFVGIAVPVSGLATAGSLGVLGDAWLIASIVLTGLAAAVLAGLVLPRQNSILADLDPTAVRAGLAPAGRTIATLAMHTGMFNVLWVVVTVLMILRPGSTTGT